MFQWTLSEPRLEGGLPLEGEHFCAARRVTRSNETRGLSRVNAPNGAKSKIPIDSLAPSQAFVDHLRVEIWRSVKQMV